MRPRVPSSLLISLCALAVSALAASYHAGAVGGDHRRILLADGHPWDAVGRVERGGDGFCTGVLVAPDEVLTAAHCLWDSDRRQLLPASSIHFVAGFRRGAYVAHARAKRLRTDPALAFDASGVPNRLGLDWAVVELEGRLHGVMPVPLAGTEARRAVLRGIDSLARVGYGRDRPYLPVIVEPCRPVAVVRREGILLHDCDAVPGDSGSPLLVRWDDDWRLLALQVAVMPHEDRRVGAAVLLGRVIPRTAFR